MKYAQWVFYALSMLCGLAVAAVFPLTAWGLGVDAGLKLVATAWFFCTLFSVIAVMFSLLRED